MSGHPWLEPYEEKNVARRLRRCVHFNGLIDLPITRPSNPDRACAAEVMYRTVKEPKEGGGFRIPCFTDDGAAPCPKSKFMTRDEAIADWLKDKARMEEYFGAIKRGECPNHKRPVKLRQVGHCVYGDCGCRLYQGQLPKASK